MTAVKEFTWDYYPLAVVSCVVFLFFYMFASPLMSARLFPTYSKLGYAKQIEWNTRGDSEMARVACAILVGYMVADLLVIMVHYKQFGEICYIFHHCTCIYAYYFTISYGVLPWFAMYRLMAELSTPFINQRWFFDVLGYPKSSLPFIVNGLAMTVVFCLVRIVTIPLYYFKIYGIWGIPGWDSLGHIRFVLVYSCLILDAMNLFWFHKIFHGARKVLGQSWQNSKPAKAA